MRRALILAKYHAFSLWNWRSSYLGRLIEPVAYFAFLAVGIAGLAASSGATTAQEYLRFVLFGMVCLLAFRAATAALSDVANDRKWGVYAIFTMQGGTPLAYLASIALISCAVFASQAGILLVLAWAVGAAGLTLTDLAWVLGLGLVIVCGWVGIGAAVGSRIQSYARRDFIVTVSSLPVVLAAPLFYPLDSAPGYLRAIAAANPLTYQVGWLRLDGVSVIPAISAAGAWLAGTTVVAVMALARADRLSTER